MLAVPVHTQSAPAAPLVHTGSLQSVSALVCLLWIPSFAWVPIAGQIRLDNSSLVFSRPACLCCLVRPTRHVHAHSHVHTSPRLASPTCGVSCPHTPAIPTKRIQLFATYTHSWTAAVHSWKEGLAQPPHTHLSIVQPLQTSLHPTQSQSLLQSLSLFPRAQFRTGLSARLRPKIHDRPQSHRLVRATLSSTKAQDARYLAFWLSGIPHRYLWTFTPLIPTTAGRQFVPRNRRDEPANRTRARHSDKVSTRWQTGLPGPQPSLSLRARPISACTAPFYPGQNLNTSAIPAPPSLIPLPQSTLPCPALPCLH